MEGPQTSGQRKCVSVISRKTVLPRINTILTRMRICIVSIHRAALTNISTSVSVNVLKSEIVIVQEGNLHDEHNLKSNNNLPQSDQNDMSCGKTYDIGDNPDVLRMQNDTGFSRVSNCPKKAETQIDFVTPNNQ